jgi:hypothetical protein
MDRKYQEMVRIQHDGVPYQRLKTGKTRDLLLSTFILEMVHNGDDDEGILFIEEPW